jgi:hypothetical protein
VNDERVAGERNLAYRTCAGFHRVATLVNGSLQRLQFTRYGREDGSTIRVFESETLALDYLRDDGTSLE